MKLFAVMLVTAFLIRSANVAVGIWECMYRVGNAEVTEIFHGPCPLSIQI
jgi:hypothetical protein